MEHPDEWEDSPPPETSRKPVNIDSREMRSNAPMPSMEVTVASGLSSVSPCVACAMHSHPAQVLKTHWYGAVAFSTAETRHLLTPKRREQNRVPPRVTRAYHHRLSRPREVREGSSPLRGLRHTTTMTPPPHQEGSHHELWPSPAECIVSGAHRPPTSTPMTTFALSSPFLHFCLSYLRCVQSTGVHLVWSEWV